MKDGKIFSMPHFFHKVLIKYYIVRYDIYGVKILYLRRIYHYGIENLIYLGNFPG